MFYFIFFPALGMAIGWFTNWLALKLLFWPRRPLKLAGLAVQGVIPRRRPELAAATGAVVARELLSHAQLAVAINRPQMRYHVGQVVDEAVTAYLEQHPGLSLVPTGVRRRLAMAVGARARTEVEGLLAREGEYVVEAMLSKVDVAALVEERLLALEWDQLEKIVFSVSGRELKYIEIMGGILGGAIGLVQAVVLWLLG